MCDSLTSLPWLSRFLRHAASQTKNHAASQTKNSKDS